MMRPIRIARYKSMFFQSLLLATWIGTSGQATAAVQEGDKVKPLVLEKREGGNFQFPQDVEGKIVFLNFWASWCPECKIELPELAKISDRYKNKPFIMLFVNMDRKRRAADRYLKKLKFDLFVLYDTDQETVKYFSPVGVPASYLIGSDGKVKKLYLGFKKEYIEKYIRDIEALIEEGEQQTASSQAEGAGGEPVQQLDVQGAEQEGEVHSSQHPIPSEMQEMR